MTYTYVIFQLNEEFDRILVILKKLNKNRLSNKELF